MKAQAWLALRQGLRKAGVNCEAVIDGPAVPGPGLRRFQPDALVHCNVGISIDSRLVDNPVIIVEVLSPSTEGIDLGIKLESYFALPSVQHYLAVSSASRRILHYRRFADDRALVTIVRAGGIELEPPGIAIAVEDIYDGSGID